MDRSDDGLLSFSAYKHVPTLSGLRRVAGESGTTHIGISCATQADREAVEGGAAVVLDRCPAPMIDVTLELTGRTRVAGGTAARVGAGPDAGAPDAG